MQTLELIGMILWQFFGLIGIILAVAVAAAMISIKLEDRGAIIECRCGQQFGHKAYSTFLYSEDGVPVSKDHGGSRDVFTRMKARLHRRFTCAGGPDESGGNE